MDKKDNFDEIIAMERPRTEETLKRHPKMSLRDRAKIFAPFAALRGHSERLGEEDVKLMRSERVELSEDEARMLSGKLSQVRKGMNVTVTGIVTNVDLVYRVVRIDVGEAKEAMIQVEEILDVSGEEIVDMMIFE